MQFYARPSWRLTRQVIADVFVLAWGIGWWFVGRFTDGVIRAVAEPSRQAGRLAEDLRAQTADVANQAAGIPLVGDDLRQPFDGMAATLNDLAGSASAQVTAIEQTATVAGVLAFAIPVALMIVIWLPRRLAFARRISNHSPISVPQRSAKASMATTRSISASRLFATVEVRKAWVSAAVGTRPSASW